MRYKGICILLDWFRSQGNESISKNRLNRISQSIEITLHDNLDQYRLEKYINPLLAIGLIEYQLNSRYSLAPTIAITSNKNIVLINFPLNQLEVDNSIVETSYSGHIVKLNSISTKQKFNCLNKKRSQNIIREYPNLNQIVNSWEPFDSLDEGYVTERLTRYGWKQEDLSNNGIYRFKDYAGSEKLLKLENSLLLIPTSNTIDSFALAYQLTSLHEPFTYDMEKEILEVNTFFFPVIAQRLLIHLSNFRFEYDETKLTLFNISNRNFEQIKSKFNAQ